MREQIRLRVLNEVEGGRLAVREAAGLMQVSARQARRLRAAYRREGAGGLAHGNRGRQPRNAVDAELAQRVVALAKERYRGVNQQHMTELLEEEEQIRLSRSTVRRVLLRAGIRSPQTRRAPQHRSRRERKPREGMLLQVDGSPHDWLEGRGPRMCMVGAIDDATSHVPGAVFRRQEDIQGYFTVLRQVVKTKGVPLSLYHDKHTIFLSPKKEVDSIEGQLAGERPLTQVGRALRELGITSIPADSAEAKGRIERLWRTFQDRLTSELRLANACTMDERKRYCSGFCPATTADSWCRQPRPRQPTARWILPWTLPPSSASSTCAPSDVTTWCKSRDAACRYSRHKAEQATPGPESRSMNA